MYKFHNFLYWCGEHANSKTRRKKKRTQSCSCSCHQIHQQTMLQAPTIIVQNWQRWCQRLSFMSCSIRIADHWVIPNHSKEKCVAFLIENIFLSFTRSGFFCQSVNLYLVSAPLKCCSELADHYSGIHFNI